MPLAILIQIKVQLPKQSNLHGLPVVCFYGLLLFFSFSATASYKDDIGYTSLQVQLDGSVPSGANVPVMQVEAATSFVDHDNDPGTADYPVYLPDNTDTQFSGKTILDNSNLATGAFSGHATNTVGKYIYGNATSIAPDINVINAYWTDDWLQGGYLRFGSGKPLSKPDRVANNSWIGDLSIDSDTSSVLRRIDWVVNADEIIISVGVRNTSGANSSLLSGAYNVIAVGKSDGNNGFGTKQLDTDYTAGRIRPEIVVPVTTSSSATAVASAAVSLMVETSQSNTGLSDDPVESSTTNRDGDTIYNAERSEVIKSILMAGAERVTSNSTGHDISDYRVDAANQTSNGLDIRYGAGQLNIQNSYNIIVAGEQNSDEDDLPGSGLISEDGFDYDPSFGGANSSNTVSSYYFQTNSGSRFITATLVWNIDIDGGNGPFFSGAAELHDLDLKLYDITDAQTLIFDSSSAIDNSESIWGYLPEGRDYILQVIAKAGQSQFEWDYGLAWHLTAVADSDGDGLNDYIEGLIGTNPLLVDTDGDTVSDFDEVNWDGDPEAYDPNNDLNPFVVDSDADQISDAMEIVTGNDPLDISDFPVWGDVNDDGLVNVIDVLLATRSIFGDFVLSDAQLARSNVAPLIAGLPEYEQSGSINTADLLLIQRKALGQISF